MHRNIFHIYFKQKFILNLLWSHCISRNTHFWTHIYLHYLRVVWFCKKGSLFCKIILKKIFKKNIFLLLLLKIKKNLFWLHLFIVNNDDNQPKCTPTEDVPHTTLSRPIGNRNMSVYDFSDTKKEKDENAISWQWQRRRRQTNWPK